ncbi:MAG: GIY-YIG nuclease family protein [Chloroflexi bacterium]|nr:MAG: GIY-YIG nuclease family protein [Chloroflexota bacterium]
MFTVYALRNPKGRLYIGQTDDLDGRLAQHQAGEARWTSSRGPWQLVWTEAYGTGAEAVKRERALKSGRLNQVLRAEIEERLRRAGPSGKD